jgi:spectinomycin phosphotransferase
MKHDDKQIREAVLDIISTRYKIKVTDCTFIPVGEESYGYKITTFENQTYFAKYCAKPYIIANLKQTHQLLLQLQHLNFIVPPISAHGQTSFDLNQGKVYLYPYIQGPTISITNDKLEADKVNQLTQFMAQIHTTPIHKIKLPKEDFSNTYHQRLNKLLLALSQNKVSQEAGDLLETNKDLIRTIIDKYEQLAQQLLDSNLKMVLTHGDITGLNIIQTTNGMKLIDWDGAMIAPAEKDLKFLLDNPNFSIQTYLDLTDSSDYNPQVVEYYSQQWSLDSIMERSEMLSSGTIHPDQVEEYTQKVQKYLSYYR